MAHGKKCTFQEPPQGRRGRQLSVIGRKMESGSWYCTDQISHVVELQQYVMPLAVILLYEGLVL